MARWRIFLSNNATGTLNNLKVISIKDEFKKNILEVVGLVVLLTIVFIIFGVAGSLTGNLIEKIDQVRSLGDARVIYPLSYIYFVGMALALLSKPATKVHSYFISICLLASNGLFFFFSLMAAYRLYFFSSMTIGVIVAIILFLIIPVAVDAVSRSLESKATNKIGRISTAIIILSASVGLLIDPNSIPG